MNGDEDARELAQSAMNRISTHEQLCAERYERIAENQEKAEMDRERLRALISERTREIYQLVHNIGRGLIIGMAGIILGGLGWVLVHLMTK